LKAAVGSTRSAVRARKARLASLLSLSALLLLPACISEAKEQELGDGMAATVNQQLSLVRNPLLNAYVSSLGRAIAAVSGRPNLDYHFYIINSEAVNAFALPGGHVYITRGLIARTSSGPELAGVLAHEIGHVVKRHGVEKLQRHLRTGSLVNVLYSIILGGEPAILNQNSLQLAGFLWTANHSREDEQEADKLAVQYLIRAGVDPRGMLSLLQSLLAVEEADSSTTSSDWFSSHPLTASRIVQTEAEIRDDVQDVHAVDNAPELKFASYPAFLRLIAALPPAPDAARVR
jgi:beta-barrel assembly-enhancing protease